MDFDNISHIISSLSEEDIASLKSTAASLFGGEKEEKEEMKGNSDFDFSSVDPRTLGKISRMMSILNSSSSSPRCDLIKALKPLLSQDKRKRADEAMQIMRLLDILPLIQEMR